uniref:Uncharacterized protein n=1 Tax=Arundo donax TaxID=35708 RepID=A0A0A8YGM7_ARUDO
MHELVMRRSLAVAPNLLLSSNSPAQACSCAVSSLFFNTSTI